MVWGDDEDNEDEYEDGDDDEGDDHQDRVIVHPVSCQAEALWRCAELSVSCLAIFYLQHLSSQDNVSLYTHKLTNSVAAQLLSQWEGQVQSCPAVGTFIIIHSPSP